MTSSAIKQAEDIKNTSEIVYSALFAINQLCNSIINAEITMNELMVCRKYDRQLQALCSAANSGNIHLCPNLDSISSAMNLCFKKFEYVEKCSKMMEVVVKYCDKISKGTYVLT